MKHKPISACSVE